MPQPLAVLAEERLQPTQIEQRIEREVGDLLCSLPVPSQICTRERRGIIARYSAVLEGNFIYWMAATLLSARSEEARSVIMENLREEVRDCHPVMMRKFALAANALPTDSDALAVHRELTNVRRLAGRLSGVQMILMMTFFESFIQGCMAFLAELARLEGSDEFEYTDVHGICDIAHTKELFRALSAEVSLAVPEHTVNPFEGMEALKALILNILRLTKSEEPILHDAAV